MNKSGPVQYWNLGIGPINCHAWNKDRSQVAVCASSPEVHILEWRSGEWVTIHVLNEHDLPVTGIDWAPETNKIVTCSQDKNAFVWTYENGSWKPELVVVRINRAATCVRWSPMENKFAVGSGDKLVAICYYERENNWWVSKHIKKPIRSTVTCIDWHPNNVLLAVGACDFKNRVFSAFIKEVDEKVAPNPWGTKMPFGQLMSEFSSRGWVHQTLFSPSGCRLAWVSHDSSLTLVDANESKEAKILSTPMLPFTCLRWVSENSLLAAGHDCSPVLYAVSNGDFKQVCKLDVQSTQQSTTSSAREMFQSIDKRATSAKVDTQLKTLHQNTVMQILPHSGTPNNVLKVTTCAVDGLIAVWDLKESIEYCRNANAQVAH
ncbi:hypothetical protein PMAYCL1PPCAC_12748 [Pristionchus mayeri]|uniref:Actin-related protein 2/3 complex subunit n=1 Tax=Pristionchus mayeri TaxID=1317129 RepID=A0AAN4ZPW4_9BILA|nr:hypothetical protein PMAYCL1PPCAC_12748 [Pristionchus mayeri]